MSKNLIIVESAAKTRTIGTFLGPDYRIEASMGHVRDLPKRDLGVDVDHGFEPTYRNMRDKSEVIKRLREAAKTAETVYLATDPDREGEAIAWHLCEALGLSEAQRIEFNEITQTAVESALAHPRRIDMERVNAQQARRVLDRLYGYKLSELLWRKIKNARSAGRVQSIAVRMIVEREREIRDFVAEEYWRVLCIVHPDNRPAELFEARLEQVRGEKVEVGTLPDEAAAQAVIAELQAAELKVADLRTRTNTRQPPPPHITSTLQRDASNRLSFQAQRTMRAAQQLYEGIEIDGKPTGLITYMRTDSTRVAKEAQDEARQYIKATWGAEHVGKGRRGKAPKRSQDAHECVRPTHLELLPDEVDRLLSGDDRSDLRRLYRLIWTRFVASQMAPATLETTLADLAAGPHLLRASSTEVTFPGYMSLTGLPQPKPKVNGSGEEASDDDAPSDDDIGQQLPQLTVGEELGLDEVQPSQHFTQPPPRYTEASLVKALEERGIGRPSTYAPIMTTITERRYARLNRRALEPTPLGELVTDALVDNFPQLMDIDFTASLEDQLDEVENGQADWIGLVRGFYEPFESALSHAMEHMERLKIPPLETEHQCPKCGSMMLQREGRYGPFLGCSKYPECDGLFNLDRDGNPKPPSKAVETAVACEKCGAPMMLRNSRRGPFLGCSKYPQCRQTVPMDDDLRKQLEAAGIEVPPTPEGANKPRPRKKPGSTGKGRKKS